MTKPTINTTVDDINVYPGETLTVWLNAYGREGKREAVQVELRVVPGAHGKAEIFISQKGTGAQVFHGFEDWYSMREVQP